MGSEQILDSIPSLAPGLPLGMQGHSDILSIQWAHIITEKYTLYKW